MMPGKPSRLSRELYDRNTAYLREAFAGLEAASTPDHRFRAYYPEVAITTTSFSHADSRLAYGHMPSPGHYSTTVTRPDLFEDYLLDQIGLIPAQSQRPGDGGASPKRRYRSTSLSWKARIFRAPRAKIVDQPLRDLFDVPDLNATDDHIVNGTFEPLPGEPTPAGPVHGAAGRLFAAPVGALHGDQPHPFSELRPVHQLPVLHRRVLPLRPQADGRRRPAAIRASWSPETS